MRAARRSSCNVLARGDNCLALGRARVYGRFSGLAKKALGRLGVRVRRARQERR